jgi:hypothetical protein
MTRLNYLALITETYLEVSKPIASEPTEINYNLREKLFNQILVRKQKLFEKNELITKDEFQTQCEIAIDELKEFTCTQTYLKLNNLYSELKSIENGEYDDNFYWDLVQPNWEYEKEIIQSDILLFDMDFNDVELNKLNENLAGKLCNAEALEIEKYFNNIIFNEQENKKDVETPAIDLSDSTATEKIIYLNKLGVIDFLRNHQPFSTSVNRLATILSALTGEKSGTIQSMINPILSKKVHDKNNPLNSKKALERVEQQLIKIGFDLNETI